MLMITGRRQLVNGNVYYYARYAKYAMTYGHMATTEGLTEAELTDLLNNPAFGERVRLLSKAAGRFLPGVLAVYRTAGGDVAVRPRATYSIPGDTAVYARCASDKVYQEQLGSHPERTLLVIHSNVPLPGEDPLVSRMPSKLELRRWARLSQAAPVVGATLTRTMANTGQAHLTLWRPEAGQTSVDPELLSVDNGLPPDESWTTAPADLGLRVTQVPYLLQQRRPRQPELPAVPMINVGQAVHQLYAE